MKEVYDENGIPIREFDVLKVFHFIGRRRKKHYMYKWVRVKHGQLYGLHIEDESMSGYALWCQADADGRIEGTEVVQGYTDGAFDERKGLT